MLRPETAHRLEGLPARHEAGAGHPVRLVLAPVTLGGLAQGLGLAATHAPDEPPLASLGDQAEIGAGGHLHGAIRVTGERPHCADVGVGVEARSEDLDRSRGDGGVGVEEEDVWRRRCAQSLIAGAGEAHVEGVGDHLRRRLLGTSGLGGPVVASVVDHDGLERDPDVAPQGVEAGQQNLPGVEGNDDDGHGGRGGRG
jgi:hypothetical protein